MYEDVCYAARGTDPTLLCFAVKSITANAGSNLPGQ
jgi:hypothetical protein